MLCNLSLTKACLGKDWGTICYYVDHFKIIVTNLLTMCNFLVVKICI